MEAEFNPENPYQVSQACAFPFPGACLHVVEALGGCLFASEEGFFFVGALAQLQEQQQMLGSWRAAPGVSLQI